MPKKKPIQLVAKNGFDSRMVKPAKKSSWLRQGEFFAY